MRNLRCHEKKNFDVFFYNPPFYGVLQPLSTQSFYIHGLQTRVDILHADNTGQILSQLDGGLSDTQKAEVFSEEVFVIV